VPATVASSKSELGTRNETGNESEAVGTCQRELTSREAILAAECGKVDRETIQAAEAKVADVTWTTTINV
jgi:hypothetical protein